MLHKIPKNNLPIGVFDSGMGGLTVLAACKKLLPNESFIYLGDMARLPYGTKSPDRIISYANQIAHRLTYLGIKSLLIACNTATSVALAYLQQNFPDLMIIGVVEPGASAALAVTRTNHISVLATEATIRSESYHKALRAKKPELNILGQACSLLVALAEEGSVIDDVTTAIIKNYLAPIKTNSSQIDCVILGCTHFLVFKQAISKFLGDKFSVVDSAEASAIELERRLKELNLQADTNKQNISFLVSDSVERFLRVGPLFLGEPISPNHVDLISW